MPRDKVTSAVNSLKELVILLSGLAITGAILTTIARARANVPDPSTLLLLVLVCLNIVRFYHGNMRIIDDVYISADSDSWRTRRLSVDFGVMLFIGIAFGAMGQFITNEALFFECFDVILIVDVIWYAFTELPNGSVPKIQRFWVGNNIVFVLVLTSLIVPIVIDNHFAASNLWIMPAMAVACAANTVIDFALSWPFYFPKGS